MQPRLSSDSRASSGSVDSANSSNSSDSPVYLKHEDVLPKSHDTSIASDRTSQNLHSTISQNIHSTRTNDSVDTHSVGSIARIFTTGDNNEYIYIGRQKFLRSDLYEAFGGTLQPGLAPPSTHRFANPAPLGLSAFALTTFVLSVCNARAQGITTPNIVVGLAVFYGGLVQLLAGMWEISLENTFGGTALASYGGFWMSFGAIYIPWFGILDAYEGREDELGSALGFYLLGWCLFTWGLCLCTMKATVMFFALFFLLGLTFLLLAISEFMGGAVTVKRAAGGLGVVVACVAWYNAFAGLSNKQNSYIVAHSIPLPINERVWV